MTGTRAILVAAAFVVCASKAVPDDAKKLEFFESRIRPVLVKECYRCHSSGDDSVKGSLLLDSAQGWKTGGDSGPAIVPGKPSESLLIEALRYEGYEMPPDRKLPDAVVRDFEKWVADGAVDPRSGTAVVAPQSGVDIEAGRQHWAFQPVRDVTPPVVEHATGIDAFIQARLATAGLTAASPAPPATLVRRMYYDLIGLPPTPEELEQLLAQPADELAETLVDRLLASEEFGVRWGRHWLDVARYADSNGGDFNATFHNAWKYRDYVVQAMNDDKPFDQFIREQLAGDLLPVDSNAEKSEHLIATGFLMLGTKMLSERDKDKLRMDVVDEQINTVGSAFLGLTLGCARCHDHKFDPVPTRDYYALAGIFRSTRTLEGESQRYVSTWRKTRLPVEPERVVAYERWEKEKKQIEADLKAAEKKLKRMKPTTNPWVVDDQQAEKKGQWTSSSLSPHFVGESYIHDNRELKGKKSIHFRWKAPASGTYEVRLSYTSGDNRAPNVPVRIEHSEGFADIIVDQRKAPELDNLFTAVGRFHFAPDAPAAVTISTQNTEGFVIADAVQFVEVTTDGTLVEQPVESPETRERILQQKLVRTLKTRLGEIQKSAPPALPKAIAVGDLDNPADCRIRIRGDHTKTGESVPRGFVQVVSRNEVELPPDQSGRRELAAWISDSQHPLTARVIVNRVWSHLMGQGIVRTVDNFGRLGDPPSHPELLDYLAHRFVTPRDAATASGAPGLGWSIKGLVREIMLSDVYQQSSAHRPEAYSTDPANRLLWKAHRRAVSAESLRDTLLHTASMLDLSPGQSPVQGLGVLVRDNKPDDEEYARPESQKRSLYMPIIRNELPPILTAFDFADPDLVVGKRPVTNVPAQALLLMNSPFVMNCSDQAAAEICQSDLTVEAAVTAAYMRILSRYPTHDEMQRALAFLGSNSPDSDPTAELLVTRLARLIHTMYASTEFRMPD